MNQAKLKKKFFFLMLPKALVNQPVLSQKILGEGKFGKVVRANLHGKDVAVKLITIDLGNCTYLQVTREIIIFSAMQPHPNICEYIGWYWKSPDCCAIVNELGLGGTLFDRVECLGTLSECETRRIFVGIVDAVRHMHKSGYIHCDLKLENMVLDLHGNAKLIDFGLVNTSAAGTLNYCSPEKRSTFSLPHPSNDVWSLGVCIFSCTLGFFPFLDSSDRDWRYLRVRTQQDQEVETFCGRASTCKQILSFYKKTHILSENLIDLLDGMFRIHIPHRLTMSEVQLSIWMSVQNARRQKSCLDLHSCECHRASRVISFSELSM